jgi:hypothetical protein
MKTTRIAGSLFLATAFGIGGGLSAQHNPLMRQQPEGLGVSPTFEGWYQNPNGTYTLSFGFMNRNTGLALAIPVGPSNFVEPGVADQGQPTYFDPRRSYGVFTVTVPSDFGPDDRVTWTLEANGERWSIPGGLLASYETDNLHARATDRYPPVLVMEPNGVESRGPNGAHVRRTARVGHALELDVAAWDQDDRPVTLRWYKYRGPGDVTFSEQESPIGEGRVDVKTTATFDEPGDYVLYVRADHSDMRVSAAGLEQCCWTNGYVDVSVGDAPGAPSAGARAGSGARSGDPDAVTFARDVAPILQENCQECHQAGSIAPFSLTTYRDARRWASRMRDEVADRIMPPWHLNPHLGIRTFKNDRSLTDEEIATILAWVDAGAPEGDPADLPEPVTFPTGENFQMLDELGPPDLVIKTDPFTVPAHGNDQWWRPVVPTRLTKDRWVRAMEVLPSFPEGRGVTHHFLATAVQEHELGGLLTEWAIGKVGEQYQEGTGKLLQAGSEIDFEVHYYPNGTEVQNDQVSLGIWLYPEDYVPEHETALRIFNIAPQATLEIPPYSKPMFQNEFLMQDPVRIQSFQAHMHLRGKGMSMEAIYPDGRKELLSIIDDFQFNWHNNYIYADDAAPLLPAGTILKFSVWYDNTTDNAVNPHAGDFVTWGDRAADEMGHAWVGVTTLTQEDYDRLVAERARRTATDREEGDH